MTPRHYLTVDDLSVPDLHAVLDLADDLKRTRASPGSHAGRPRTDLAGHSIGMIFEKPSTRTRVSFEVGIAELGATPVVLSAGELQLGRGETIEDTARVLSRYLHALVVRTYEQDRLTRLAAAGTIPIVNALSDHAHPCQALADLQTIRERRGGWKGLTLAYLGDGNNVAHSLLRAGAMAGMRVVVGCPPGFEPDAGVVAAARDLAAANGGSVAVTPDPVDAARGADVLYTDVWASMGQEADHDARIAPLQPYQLNERLVDAADPDAIVLHCLPAHRGEEITAAVIDGPRSAVWDQAENRLHTQKALLLHLLTGA